MIGTQRFGDSTEPSVRQQVAKALRNKGFTLGTFNRSEEAIAVHDEIVKRFRDDTKPAMRDILKETLQKLENLQKSTDGG